MNQPEICPEGCEEGEDNAIPIDRVEVKCKVGEGPTQSERLKPRPYLERLMQDIKVSLIMPGVGNMRPVSVGVLLDGGSGVNMIRRN